MKSDERSNQAIPECDVCERKLNPTARVFNHNECQYSACFQHIQNLPEIVAKSVEWFLIETMCESLKHRSAQIIKRGAAYAY